MIMRIRGVVLPEREERTFWVDGERLRTEPPAGAGLPVEEAIGAASWTARDWLGLPGLIDGAPADLVAYGQDPTAEPGVLGQPKRVILRGRIVR